MPFLHLERHNSSGLDKPVYIQNTFGGSLGGPIRRNRTFIFGNFQGRRSALWWRTGQERLWITTCGGRVLRPTAGR
jgi:hypothetical protein